MKVTAAGAVTRYEPRHEGNVWNTHSDLNVAALVAADLLRPEQQKQQVTCISRVGQKYDRRVNWSALHWSANKSTPSPDNNKTLPTDTLLSKRTQPVVGAHAGIYRLVDSYFVLVCVQTSLVLNSIKWAFAYLILVPCL